MSNRLHVRRTVADHPAPTPQPTPCRLWQGGLSGAGYGRILTGSKAHLMHRWVMRAAGVDRFGTEWHQCDQPLCYRWDHLRIGTHAENSADMIRKGRGRGQFDGSSRRTLTTDDVDAIRAEWTGAYGQAAEIARRYGVHRSTVLRIAKGDARIDKQRNACVAAVVYDAQGGDAWVTW